MSRQRGHQGQGRPQWMQRRARACRRTRVKIGYKVHCGDQGRPSADGHLSPRGKPGESTRVLEKAPALASSALAKRARARSGRRAGLRDSLRGWQREGSRTGLCARVRHAYNTENRSRTWRTEHACAPVRSAASEKPMVGRTVGRGAVRDAHHSGVRQMAGESGWCSFGP
jgi:hypothetical protein